MEKRHFFEARQQREALKEFNNLHIMKELVDWDLFIPIPEEIFGPPRTSGPGRRPWDYLVIFRSLLLEVMNICNKCSWTAPHSSSCQYLN